MHTICSPHGEVLRIMVMKRSGVTAFVEFDNVDSARKAKQSLNGCDVYSGCCTLKIEFAGVRYYFITVANSTFDIMEAKPDCLFCILSDAKSRYSHFSLLLLILVETTF